VTIELQTLFEGKNTEGDVDTPHQLVDRHGAAAVAIADAARAFLAFGSRRAKATCQENRSNQNNHPPCTHRSSSLSDFVACSEPAASGPAESTAGVQEPQPHWYMPFG